ncbi:caspase family protein [Nannocystaceae bacterium ST9]
MSSACAIVRGLALALLGLVVLFAPQARAGEPEADAPLRRFALLVGANDGGREREQLRYAETDAALFGKALGELGGVASRDRLQLDDPDPATLERAFVELAKLAAAAEQDGARVQFVFYYSGHSDESGLLLGGVNFDYKKLRKLIDQVPADVRIAILDSCSSGAITRYKGGKKQDGFLAGGAAEVRGHAYLTSSSADEAAQESDRIGGSFFTHFLVTGLRGAADADGDRRVTLDEAYRFAFDETLARTEASAGGPQHAAYDIQLTGTGDLVFTDLRKTSAKLEIAADVVGRIYVRDRRGTLAAELYKAKGSSAITLALEPGDYTLTIDDGNQLHRATVAVRTGKTAALAGDELEDVAIEGTRLRGGPSEPDEAASSEAPIEGPKPLPPSTRHIPFNIGVAPGADINRMAGGAPVLNNFSFSLAATKAYRVGGIQAAVGAAWTDEDMRGIQSAVGAVWAKGRVSGIQAAAGVTIAHGDMRGMQSAAVNLGFARVAGLQLGTVQWAKRLEGVQVGGVNVAGSAKGMQVGLVSLAKGDVKGLQIGLVTYADSADAAIALIPITKQGGVHPDVWTSDVHLVNLGLRFRARKTYSIIAAGLHPFGSGASWSFGLGFGGPLFKRPRFRVELDNGVHVGNAGLRVSGAPFVLDTLRLTVGWTPAKHFALWGGVTGNAMLMPDLAGREDFVPGYFAHPNLASVDSKVAFRAWPGFVLGFEF